MAARLPPIDKLLVSSASLDIMTLIAVTLNLGYTLYPVSSFIQSDPDLPPDHGSPSPTDEVFSPAPAPPPYMPPQPSIEEARQQMHSLLDDAFALVSPSSLGSAGLSGVSPALASPSPQAHPPGRQWGSYPAAPSHSPFSAVSV